MKLEPYPWGRPEFENPSLVASDDGLQWQVPKGLINPIVAAPPTGWHSDGALCVCPDNRLHLYYRYNSGAGETMLLRRTAVPGLQWKRPEALLRFPVSGRFASPSFVRWRGGLVMLYVDTIAQAVMASASTSGCRWTRPTHVLSFPGAWHVAARAERTGLHLLLNAGRHLYLLRHHSDRAWQARDQRRWRSFSRQGAAPILCPSPNGWDSGQLYRGSFLVHGTHIRIWYSARSNDGSWHIGHAGDID